MKYIGIDLDRRLTWKLHIEANSAQIKLKLFKINWLIGKNLNLGLDSKTISRLRYTVEIYKIFKDYKILLTTPRCWYIKTSNIHKDIAERTIKSEIAKFSVSYLNKVETRTNPVYQ